MNAAESLRIEVCYALAGEQVILGLEVPPGTTFLEAIAASKIVSRFPQIDLRRNKVGVFGRLRALNECVSAGDRIEIYRELVADPKAQRHQRVEQARRERARSLSRPRKA